MLLSDSARVNSPNFLAFSSRFGEELVGFAHKVYFDHKVNRLTIKSIAVAE